MKKNYDHFEKTFRYRLCKNDSNLLIFMSNICSSLSKFCCRKKFLKLMQHFVACLIKKRFYLCQREKFDSITLSVENMNIENKSIYPKTQDLTSNRFKILFSASTEVKLDVIKKIEKVSRVLQMHPITNTCSNLLATIPEFAGEEWVGIEHCCFI